MGLLDLFRQLSVREERDSGLSLESWMTQMSYAGNLYPLLNIQQTLRGKEEPIGDSFAGLVNGAYKANGVVFACELVRMSLFSEARFQFQGMKNGRPGDLYGTPALRPLENPWQNATTADLLTKALVDADFAGNAFIVRIGTQLKRLRPDWVTLVLTGENGDPDTELEGIVYEPGGPGSGKDLVTFDAAQVCHFAPIPDPIASFRGMSWVTPVIREIQADNSATTHKEASFQNGATPNMIVKLDVNNTEKFEAMKKLFREAHEGAINANKTLFLAGGADATVVGQTFQQMDFKSLQGSAETRIAAAAGVHPAIVGLSEGLQGSSLNAGNFTAAARLTGDKTLRPLWRNFCGSIEHLIDVPGGSRLWYDDRDIAFLKADVKDAAEVQQVQAQSIKALIDAGYEPDSITLAIQSGDWSKLTHTGLFSVQLQPPMPEGPPAVPTPAENMQMAFAPVVEAIVRANETRKPDVNYTPVQVTTPDVHVTTPATQIELPEIRVEAPAVPVTVFNRTTEPEELRDYAAALPPPEVNVNLDSVARMVGEVEARRILEAEKAEEAAAQREAEARERDEQAKQREMEAAKRHEELIEQLKPAPPVKMVRRVKRDSNGLLELIIDEPETG